MRILMLNPVHPDTPHISAVRAWRFARELARLGHRVVLLTATSDDQQPSTALDPNHDWASPAVLPCAAFARQGARQPGALPGPLRRTQTLVHMLRNGGREGAWCRAAVHSGTALHETFAPDVVWATFGRLEAVVAARRIAQRLRLPWVLDIKDGWELYVPRGLRHLMAWRIRGFEAVTANAGMTRGKAARWQAADATLIYSGVDDCFFADTASPTTNPPFAINLVGGIYFPEKLRAFLAGTARWYRALPARQQARVCLRHIGSQGALVQDLARTACPELRLELPGYLPTPEMAKLCRQAGVNAYIRHTGTFHHKLLELLACGRPILAYPTECDESHRLAKATGGQLLACDSPAAVAKALSGWSARFFAGESRRDTAVATSTRHFNWRAQTQRLEAVLAHAAHHEMAAELPSCQPESTS